MFIFSLYQSVLLPILSDWLHDDDLCRLDTSICNHKYRTCFLANLQLCRIFNSNFNDAAYFDWLLLRGIKLKSLNLSNEYFSNFGFAQFLSDNSHLVWLQSNIRKDVVTLLEHELTVDCFKTTLKGDFLKTVLDHIHGIQHLDLTRVRLDENDYNTIISHCPELKSFTAGPHTNIHPLVAELADLQHLYGCQLYRTLGRFDCGATYYVDLKRVDSPDASSLSIEGKYFHIVKLNSSHMDEVGAQTLQPFLGPVESLHLSYCFTGMIEAAICSCTRLLSLCIERTTMIVNTDKLISLLQKSVLLREVHFYRVVILGTDTVLFTLANHCPNLEKLTIDGRYMDKEKLLMSLFDRCPQLKEVTLARGLPSDRMIRHLASGLSRLTIDVCSSAGIKRFNGNGLAFRGRRITGYFNFPRVFARNPLLTSVELVGMKELTDYKLGQLVDCCSLLNKVTICHNAKATVVGLHHLVRLSSLTDLNLDFQTGLSPSFFVALMRDKPYFTRLSLVGCSDLSGESIPLIGSLCPLLRYLDVSGLITINSEQVIALLQCCQQIQTLLLSGCNEVDEKIFFALSLRKRMRYLSLLDTGIAKDALEKFVQESKFTCTYNLCI